MTTALTVERVVNKPQRELGKWQGQMRHLANARNEW